MDDFPRCKTCRFFVPAHRDEDGDWRSSECTNKKIDMGYIEYDEKTQPILQVEGDEGWGMIPREDFGCVLHEERENG